MYTGSYQPGKPVVCIMSVSPTFTVLSSKQHPRKLSIKGTDGHDHMFLLKGYFGILSPETLISDSYDQ